MLKDHEDAFGHSLYDYLDHQGGREIVERNDGWIEVTAGPKAYFAEYGEWSDLNKAAIQHACGRVLDIGCGAGRHALYLQQRGLDVVGIDNSPLAIEVCRTRGLKRAQALSVTQIGHRLGMFDTVLMLGNNFGLFGSVKRAKWLLKKLRGITSPHGHIIAEGTDPYQTKLPGHLAYHEHNRKQRRMSGQLRIRIRYRKYATPWFDYLLASKQEVKCLVKGTRWEVGRFIDGESARYIAIIERASESIA